MDVLVKNIILEIPRTIIGELYEQNKAIQRHESDTAVPIDEISINIRFMHV